MVLLWFAGGAMLLVAAIWTSSWWVMRRKGGAVEVDNDRDINDRYFAEVLRRLLRPVLEPGWGRLTPEGWWLGDLAMHRKAERVALYRGDLRLDAVPYPVGALVVTGNLEVVDGTRLGCDIWCLGDVTVGQGCRLRSLAAEGSIILGPLSAAERWVDAGKRLHLAEGVSIWHTASAGEELFLESGFRGGKLAAPVVRISATEDRGVWEAARERLAVFRSLREQYGATIGTANLEGEPGWIQAHSTCTEGRYWIGSGAVLLHDLVVQDGLEVAEDCVIAGSVHVNGPCHIGRGTLVTGHLTCEGLTMEAGAVVGGSVHVDGDALVAAGAIVGLIEEAGGLAVTGSVQLDGEVAVTGRIQAADTLSTGPVRRKVG